MLKNDRSGVPLSRPSPLIPPNLLPGTNFQTPADPHLTTGSPDKWGAYVNGGAKADDARLHQKRRQEAAIFEATRRNSSAQSATTASSSGNATAGRLIKTSPKKVHVGTSAKNSLLLDLDFDSKADLPQVLGKSYASETKPGQWEMNLLD